MGVSFRDPFFLSFIAAYNDALSWASGDEQHLLQILVLVNSPLSPTLHLLQPQTPRVPFVQNFLYWVRLKHLEAPLKPLSNHSPAVPWTVSHLRFLFLPPARIRVAHFALRHEMVCNCLHPLQHSNTCQLFQQRFQSQLDSYVLFLGEHICDTLIYFCNRQCPPFFKHNETIYDRLHGHVLENTPPKVVHRAVGTKIRPRLLVGDVYPPHEPAVVSPNGRLLFWSAFLVLTPSLFLPAKQ